MPSRPATAKTIPIARIAVIAAACVLASVATARDFEIRHHERISPRLSDAADRLSFVAYGRQFDLELESNARIVAARPAERAAAAALYRGRLVGQPGSWARLSRTNGRLRGAIFDGTELWLIDSAALLEEWLDNPEPAPGDTPVIFRLSEVGGDIGDLVASSTAADIASAPAASAPAPALRSSTQTGLALDIGLVATADFSERHGSHARAALLELFNIVEGVFVTQVGVQLRAAEITLLDATPASLEGTDAAVLIDAFATWKRRAPEHYFLGLSHLFVARDLDDANPPVRTVGIANIGVLCDRRYGVSITQATNSTVFDALIATHEIAHNFGAPHDGDPDYACAAESENYIMSPRLGNQTSFSQCSIAQMQPEIESAGCMLAVSPTDLQLTVTRPPPLTISETAAFDFEVALSNLSDAPVSGLELSATTTALSRPSLNTALGEDASCGYEQGTLRCIWPSFGAGRSLALKLSASGGEPGQGSVRLSVDSLNETDPSNNTVTFDIAIVPANGSATARNPEPQNSGAAGNGGGGGSLGTAALLALAAALAARRRRRAQASSARAHQGQ